jgi:hypothetical protein
VTGKAGLIALLGAAVAGPTAAIVWPTLVKWPVVIGYEILLFIIGLFSGVASELRKRWQTRLTDRLDKALGRRLSRFDRRYREYVLSNLRFVDVKGLGTIGFYTPDLDEVFVDVSLDYRAPHQVPAGLLGDLPPDAESRHSISDFLNRKQPAVLAVLGAPGSGKTTLLRHTARRVFESKKRDVPILLYLRDHVAQIAENPRISLPALIRHALGSHADSEPADWFDQKLRQGECVVLLDGLDEVARQEDRRRVADWVELQINRYSANDFVLTSRPHGYQSAPVEGATVLQARSFTDQQVRTFVHGWYLAVLRHKHKAATDHVKQEATREAEDLLGRLYDSPALADLTVNPLLLTMIANVHQYRGALPGSRVELYNEICQVMLWRRQEAKKLHSDLDGGKKETLLRGLAFAMMQRNVRDLQEHEVIDELGTAMVRVSRKVSPDDFLDEVSSNGLLVERESGLFSFAHHTFQEFLAASHIREKGMVNTLADHVDDIWWRETTLLYTARSDADLIVQACLKSGSVTALSLAFDCAEQDSELDPDLRESLENIIKEALAPGADASRRKLAAAVLVTRHLRHMVRAGNGGRVCPVPITNKIYYLFRHEVPLPMPDGTQQFELDDDPVVGVRQTDSIAFALWACQAAGGEQDYRLPTADEINQPAIQRAIGDKPLSSWLASSGELWVSPVGANPLLVEGLVQMKYVENDILRLGSTLTRIIVLWAALESHRVAHKDAHQLMTTLVRSLDQDRDRDLGTALDLSFTVATHASSSDWSYALMVARRISQLRHGGYNDAEIGEVIELASGIQSTDAMSEFDHLLGSDGGSMYTSALRLSQRQAASAPVLDTALSMAAFAAIMGGRTVSAEFILRTRADESNAVDLDKLGSGLPQPSLDCPDRSSSVGLTERFAAAAHPVFHRHTQITSEKATALRLAALCLAAKADKARALEVADEYRMLAAGVTLLERRMNGESTANETIILATG